MHRGCCSWSDNSFLLDGQFTRGQFQAQFEASNATLSLNVTTPHFSMSILRGLSAGCIRPSARSSSSSFIKYEIIDSSSFFHSLFFAAQVKSCGAWKEVGPLCGGNLPRSPLLLPCSFFFLRPPHLANSQHAHCRKKGAEGKGNEAERAENFRRRSNLTPLALP